MVAIVRAFLVGGTEEVSLVDCTAIGTITAEGDNCFGLGELVGGSKVGSIAGYPTIPP
jgi:hypothetical protein